MEDKSLELAQSVPAESWNRIVETACDTFEKIVAPLTETTAGAGRLIKAKFDRLTEAEKVIAAENVEEAQTRAKDSERERKRDPRPSMIIRIVEESSGETDPNLRELWINLLANEMAGNATHPEFVRILNRMSPSDAKTLVDVAQEHDSVDLSFVLRGALGKLVSLTFSPDSTFTHEHLKNLNVIDKSEVGWRLTKTGIAFLKAVSDPSIEA